jgi:hypothetical protein
VLGTHQGEQTTGVGFGVLGGGSLRSRAAGLTLCLMFLVACGPKAGATAVLGPSTSTQLSSAARSGSAEAPQLHVVRAPKHVLDDEHLQPGECHIRQTAAGPLPDPACTPGAIDPAVHQSNIRTTICLPGYTSTVRPSASETDKWKRVAVAAYGITGTGEYDHLVSLELGGTNATSNLWPEPGSIPNPKDSVENRLHKEVCSGQITLAAAQQAIATNWTTAP